MGQDTVEYAQVPVPGQLMDNIAAIVQMVRMYTRDYPELNRLIEGEESSDRMIVWALIDVLDDFNSTPPPLNFNLNQIPKSIIRYGVVSVLLESVMLLAIRNQLPYSDGGINVNIDKVGQLMQVRQMMNASYEQKKREYKISANIAAGYGEIASEYWIISGFYGAW
jgi:hypothetical protein